MSKKILSMLLVLTMLVGVVATMPLTASAADYDFEITSVSDWNQFAKNASNYSNVIVRVEGGVLDFGGTAPTKASGFTGTFDGNGVVLKNITLSGSGDVGLFCSLNGATIKNMVITQSTFTCTGEYLGAVACCGTGASTIENIYIDKTVKVHSKKTSGNAYAAGIIGNYYEKTGKKLTINDCVMAGEVISSGGVYCGGIGGNISGSSGSNVVELNNCLMIGKVNSNVTSSSGLVGNGGKTTLTINNCVYAGSGFNSYPFGTAKTLTVNNSFTTAYDEDGVTHKDGNTGVTKLDSINQLIGSDVSSDITDGLTGWTTRPTDIMVPSGVAGFNLPVFVSMDTVTYQNWDGTVLQTGKWNTGEMPEYTGETPIKPSTSEFYTYEFAGWDPTVVAVNGAATYTAKFNEVLVVEELEEVDGKFYINNVYQYLYFMNNASDYNGETVKLGADLDFEGTEGIIKPITSFSGTLDGDGYTLSNIEMSGSSDVGLLGDIGTNEVTIQNLVIRSSKFEATQWTAPLVSSTKSKNLVIRNVYIAPDVEVDCGKKDGKSYAGGIIGGIYGSGATVTVDNCIFAGTVTGEGIYVAGIIGQVAAGNDVNVSNCLNAGTVSSMSTQVAGIVTGTSGITVENCVNAGNVSTSSGGSLVAGILTGNVESGSNTVKNCYTIGNAVSVEDGKEVTVENNTENLRRAELLGSSSVVALEGWTKVDGDFAMPDGAKGYVKETLYDAEMPEPEPEPETLRGEGTAEAPFLIADADEWVLFMELAADNNFDGQYVKLEADIDFDDVKLSPIEGFKGTLDGNGKVLKNINMTKAKNSGDLALFCALGDNATIKNFSIVSSTFEIKGNANWVGTVACCTNGKNVTISNIYVGKDVKVIAGKADGNSIAGGILGGVYGKIQASVLVENCVFAGTVIGTGDSVAGIVASVNQKDAFEAGLDPNTVTVRNCLNAGLVVGDNHVAGIAGGQGMTVENCVNAGTVRSKGKIVAAIATSNPYTDVVVDGCYYANGSLMAFGDRGDSLVDYGTNVYADINKLTGTNAQAPATFTKRAGDLAIPTGCTNVSETLVTLSLLDGAAVRLSDPSGIRFTAVLGGAYLNSFMGEGKTVSFGVIVTPTDYVEAAGAFKVEDLKALGHNVNYKEIAADKLQNDADADESYVFTGVLAPIKEGNYGRAFSAIAYIKVVDADGNATYYYSDYDASVNSRSIAQVAEAAYKDTNYKQTDYYQYKLDDSHTDGEAVWSPYTADDRKALLSFYRDGGAIDVSFLSYNIRNVEDTSGWLDRPTYEYTDREKYLRDYLLNYDADVIGLQEAAKLKATLGTLDWFDVIGDDDTKAGLTAAGYTCVKGEDIYGGNNSEKTMYNPIYYKTDKYDLVASGTKWLTSTPGVVSTIDGGDTTKALNYVVLEDKDGQQFLYVNIHLMVRRSNYVHDAEGNDTEHYVQELEVIYLRAILEQLQNQYPELPMFVGGDFNNSYTGINTWFKGSVVGENDWEISEGEPTEEITLSVARDQAVSNAPKRYSCTTDDFTQINPEAIEKNWGAIDLWYTSNFDGVVHVYEIVDNYNESVGKYPSDHLPAKLYVTLYTK